MWRFSDTMAKYAEQASEPDGSEIYSNNAEMILRMIDEKCKFSDYGLYSDYLDLKTASTISPTTWPMIESQSEELVPLHSTHLGIVSLFPPTEPPGVAHISYPFTAS